MQAKHNASLIITGVVIALFVVFIVLAAFVHPDAETTGITDPQMKQVAESMAQMTWWVTLALVMLPIMLILIVIAGYLFISAAKLTAVGSTPNTPSPAPSKSGLFGNKVTSSKVNEANTPTDVLDLRYARGEITRDQYMAMKTDMRSSRL
jgi:uncharacterized membrane protein